jgi:alpha-L-fucosidase
MNDDWNIAVLPGGQDLLKPLADACHEEGLQFCIYHSVMDWHHPDWPNRPAFNNYAKGEPDKARFKNYLYGELKELFTGYGPIGMVWFDGTWDRKVWTSDDGKALEDYTRSLQPSVIINNRSGYLPPQRKLDIAIKNSYSYVFAGDYISPEGEVPSTGLPGIDWETCQTMQLPNNWGYNRLVGFRPFSDLLRQLIDVASKGGNMLLNIGPAADGEILPQARQCLEKFGAWMQVNGEAIHGTTASPFEWLPFDGRCTQKPGKLFLHVFQWPASCQLALPVCNRVKKAWLLANPAASLSVSSSAKGVVIGLPPQALDPIASVVVVDIEGAPVVIPPVKPVSQGKPVLASAEWSGRAELKKDHINDGNTDTIWAGPENSREGWAQIDLGEEDSVNLVFLSEGPIYTRCSKFEVQAQVGGAWKTIASGTVIGAHKELSIKPVKARYFRLTVATDKPDGQPDGEPVISEFQLFAE